MGVVCKNKLMYACMGGPHLCVNSCCAIGSNYSDKALPNGVRSLLFIFSSFFLLSLMVVVLLVT